MKCVLLHRPVCFFQNIVKKLMNRKMCAENRLEAFNIYCTDSFISRSFKCNGPFILSFNKRQFIKNCDVFSSNISQTNVSIDVIILTEARFSD